MTFDVAQPTTGQTKLGARAALALLIGISLTLLGLILGLPNSAAAATPSLTVSPSSGLSDGQTVTVHGTGYTANVKNINVIQCPVSGAGQNTCNVQDAKLFQSTDGSGSFTVQIVVRAKIGSTDCTKVACLIDGHEGTSTTSGNDSHVTIHFGSAPVTHSSTAAGGGGSTTSSGGGSNGGSSSGSGSGAGSTPGAGTPTGANTGHQDVGTPRITATLVLVGVGALLMMTGTFVHLRRRRAQA